MSAAPELPDIPDYAFPPYVRTDDEKERWRLSRAIAEAISIDNEPSGEPDSHFVHHMTPTVYHSDIPTGTAADEPPALEEAATPDVLAELERLKPGDDAPDKEQWAHVARVCDLLDNLFGSPDAIDLGDHKLRVPPPGRGMSSIEEGLELEEMFERVFRGAYKADLHPRDRLGKWAQKLNGLRSVARTHGKQLKQHVAAGAAAARLRYDVSRAHKEGGALEGDVRRAHRGERDLATRMRAHAAEQRQRQGVSGAQMKFEHHANRLKAHALVSLAYVFSEEAEQKARKLGIPHEELTHDIGVGAETLENAKMTKELAHETAKWAVEHHEELRQVMRAVGTLAHHAARAKGLTAADVTGEDEETAELMLALVADD